ncbi:MAG: glycerophosphodiester phosphodiesterase [Frankia sp.]
MQVLGHRGSRVPGPENTVASIDAALSAGADGVEIDVRRSADGDLVVVHDSRLPRLGGRPVIRRGTAELAARGIPRLDEVLDAWAGRGRIVCEIKNQPGQPDFDAPREQTAQALIELLRKRRLSSGPDRRPEPGQPGVTVSSFDWFAIEAVRDAALGIPTAFLTLPRVSLAGGLAYVRSAGHTELHAHVSSALASNAVARVHEAGVGLVAWTVTSPDQAGRLRDAGVDAIICDDPVEIRRVIDAANPSD